MNLRTDEILDIKVSKGVVANITKLIQKLIKHNLSLIPFYIFPFT